MLVKSLTKKLLIITLIFTLTFANFAVVTKTYAVGIFEKLFTIAGTTGSKDVEFDAYFKSGDEKLESVEADVNDKDLKLYFDLNLLDEGYIKNSKISIVQAEEGKELNFKISDEFENEFVESFEENEFLLVKIEEESTNVLEIPIEYVNEKFINLEKLSGDFKVIFEGIYVDEKAKEKELSKEIILNLSWKDKKDFTLESDIAKFFQYESEGEKYSIIQTLIKIDTTSEINTLPVKNIETKIELPTVGEGEIISLAALATSTMATNNKANEEVEFGDENLTFDKENNILTIKTENRLQTVIEETEDVLKEEVEKEEEKYFSGTGVDEYLVTYKVKGLDFEEGLDLISKITVKITSYAGIGNEDSETKVEKEIEAVYTLTEETGENVSYKIENETEKLSKGYMYLNYNNEDKKYELEYKSKSIFNISTPELIDELKVEDLENYYLGKDEIKTEETNTYYKKITVSKENFNSILGKNGKIEILDVEENILGVIKNNFEEEETEKVEDTTHVERVEDTTQAENIGDTTQTESLEKLEESEEYFEVNFEEKYSKLILKISAPIDEGNLIINQIKAQIETVLDKEQYAGVASINEVKKVTAKYKEIEENVDVAEIINTVELEDTTTKSNLVLSTDKLSTLVENKDIEIKIELNNQKVTSDIYGNSVFEIEFPEYVRNIEITNSSIMYGEGLEIENLELLEANGKFFARVVVNGLQTKLSSGLLTNGTNIVLNANIVVDQYAPAKQDEIKLYYNNEESTNYVVELVENTQGVLSAVEAVQIEYSAPKGVVSVNSISNYNEENSVLTSINQGIKKDTLEILTSSKNAKMDLVIMNNSGEAISNISILGRIPFKGVKDVISEDDLNTTIDSKLLNAISGDERNEIGFKVYYSENGGATKDLELEENGWVENVENFDSIKSYLIVPENPEYVMENYKILRFSYEYLIPENLEHNTNICSAFATYYINEEKMEEVSGADIVYLTTGEGPQLQIETIVNAEKIKEFEELTIISKIENTAPIDAKDVVITIPLPEGVKFIKAEGEINSRIEENNVIIEIEKLEAGKKIETLILVEIGEVKNNLEIYSTVSAKDLAKTIESEKVNVEVLKADMKLNFVEDTFEYFTKIEGKEIILTEEYEIVLKPYIENLKDTDLNNIEANINLDSSFEILDVYYWELSGTELVKREIDNVDKEANKIVWNLEKLESGKGKELAIKVKFKKLEDGITKKTIKNQFTAKADGTEIYTSPEAIIILGGAALEINQTTDTLETYVKEGSEIVYRYEIKNVGAVGATSVNLVNDVPQGLVIKKIEYSINKDVKTKLLHEKERVNVVITIPAGEIANVVITAEASDIGQAEELSVTNSARAKGKNTEEVVSNSITHIIEQEIIYDKHGNIVSGNTQSNNNNNAVIGKTYKITGIAWLDENEDGIRGSSEKRLNGITAKLVDSSTGIIKDRTTTNTNGEYTFKNVENGNYIVIFDYDSSLYALTKYQVLNAATNVNSDVTSTTVSQDGKQSIAAVTNTITVNNGSVSNIDIGLIAADSFDLELEKSVTKITLQNAKGTNTTTYNNTKLAKTEVASKYINSSVAYIEYSIKVSNVGDLAGYAKKIVDYLPEDTTFNSGLKGNESWYSADGKLYSSALADILIAPGETKEIKLVLTKQMNEHSSSLMSNTAEIYETYNVYGAKDINSTAGNKIQNENDMSTADAIIGVKTGEVFVYTSVIITTLLLCGIVIFIINNKIVFKRRKGGA